MLTVVDASVILKWVLAGEDESEEELALDILNNWLEDNSQIILPSLWVFEVSNVLGLKKPEKAPNLLEILLDYSFDEIPVTKELCRLTFDLMHKFKVTFYDGIYHALAIKERATLITADKQYFNKVTSLKHIKLL